MLILMVKCRSDISLMSLEEIGRSNTLEKDTFRSNRVMVSIYAVTNREHCEVWEQWAIIDMPHLLTTPMREVYIRSCHQQSFCNNEGLPALVPSIIKANSYG